MSLASGDRFSPSGYTDPRTGHSDIAEPSGHGQSAGPYRDANSEPPDHQCIWPQDGGRPGREYPGAGRSLESRPVERACQILSPWCPEIVDIQDYRDHRNSY